MSVLNSSLSTAIPPKSGMMSSCSSTRGVCITSSLACFFVTETADQPTLKMYGRTFPQSRQIAAYSTTPGATLSYSGSKIDMHYPFPPVLEKMRETLELVLGVKFNHCMLNRYDDGSVYIG